MANDSHLTHLLPEARRGARQLVVDAVRWLVYELPPMPLDRRSTPSLVFESECAMRRVRDFPVNWRMLSDAELFALSWTV